MRLLCIPNGIFYYTIFLLLSTMATGVHEAAALTVDNACASVSHVFARGSGEVTSENSYSRFDEALRNRIKVAMQSYQLGTETYGGHKYPAVNVSSWWNGNIIGAKVSGGYANDYGKSVDAGVGELYTYLTQRNQKCPDEYIILGGYSQGAQVIGQTLPKLSSVVQQRIIFSALFGDPKLYLPEGMAHDGQKNPPACQGKELSSWRRYVGDCHVYEGSLGYRTPYVPDVLSRISGTWCLEEDAVCGTSGNIFKNDGHGKYFTEPGSIDSAAWEIAARLKAKLGGSGVRIDDNPGTGMGQSAGQDVVFVLDTTGSMQPTIEATKRFIRESTAKIRAMNGRVGLVVYRDAGDTYTAEMVSDLKSDPSDMLTKLDAVDALDGGDTPEAALHALMTAFNKVKWRNGANKSAIVLSDAGYHSPDMVDGTTLDDVVQRSLEIDPVNVYAVVPAAVAAEYADLANRTSGQVVVDSGDTVNALSTTLAKVAARPTPSLMLKEYIAEPNESIVFDASATTVTNLNLTTYEWDFNGDGVFDQTTDVPVVDHAYIQPFDGFMQLRVSADNSTVASVSAVVKIGTYQPPVRPAAAREFAIKSSSTTTASLGWSGRSEGGWLLSMNGVILGRIPAQNTVEITAIDRTQPTQLRLVAVAADGTIGDATEITLPVYVAPEPPIRHTTLCDTVLSYLKKIFPWLRI